MADSQNDKCGTLHASSTRRQVGKLLVALLLWPASVFAQTPDRDISAAEIEQARAAALSILEIVDKAPLSKFEFDSLYANAGDALKSRYTSDSFSARVSKVRAPLGTCAERTFYGYSGPYAHMPNLIAGDYVIMAFRTRFGNSSQVFTEQVTLEHDRKSGNGWRFVEYYEAPIDEEGSNQ